MEEGLRALAGLTDAEDGEASAAFSRCLVCADCGAAITVH